MIKDDYGETLEQIFDELGEYWKEQKSIFSPTSDESLADLSLPHNTPTRMCLFTIKREQFPFYKSYVFPIFSRYGFDPITYSDVIRPGENILAKISSLIERTSLVVIDLSSYAQFSMQEFFYAQKLKKPVLIIKEEDMDIPHDLSSVFYIERPKELDSLKMEKFFEILEKYVHQLSPQLTEQLFLEPKRLLDKGEYNAAVISVMTLLESILSRKLQTMDIPNSKMPFRKMLNYIRKFKLMPPDYEKKLQEMYMIRSELVHRGGKISKKHAVEIVESILLFANKLESAHF